ncbi:MAG: hypothetical protein ACLP05_03420 [Candidatus Kryptoniota bacterium]
MAAIDFTKMNGAGNDFVVINDFDGALNVDFPASTQTVCVTGFSVGADGIPFFQKSPPIKDGSRFSNLVLEGSERIVCHRKTLYDEMNQEIMNLPDGQGKI